MATIRESADLAAMRIAQALLEGRTPPPVEKPQGPPGRVERLPEVVDLPSTERTDLLGALLALSQGADLYMTEKGIEEVPPINLTVRTARALGFDPEDKGAYTISGLREANPLPGMQNPMGRMVWGAVENKALREARARKPKVGIPATLAAALIHLYLANEWGDRINEANRWRDQIGVRR